MLLHKIYINQRSREGRRDLSDAYQMHSTLSRAFSAPDEKCPPGEFLWRLEPERAADGSAKVIIQSKSIPDWSRINLSQWLSHAAPPIEADALLNLDGLQNGRKFRFRLRANPCVSRQGKRIGLLKEHEQMDWLRRKGDLHGFSLMVSVNGAGINVGITDGRMLMGHQRGGNKLCVYSVLYDGFLVATDADKFKSVLGSGIGHGKAMGLGLLSVVPVND